MKICYGLRVETVNTTQENRIVLIIIRLQKTTFSTNVILKAVLGLAATPTTVFLVTVLRR